MRTTFAGACASSVYAQTEGPKGPLVQLIDDERDYPSRSFERRPKNPSDSSNSPGGRVKCESEHTDYCEKRQKVTKY